MAAQAAARGSGLAAALEKHVARAEAALRREEVAALRLHLELPTLPPGEQEERLRSFLHSSDLGELEKLAAVSFLPSLGTLHLGVLLTGGSSTTAVAPAEHRVAVVTEVKEEVVTADTRSEAARLATPWPAGAACVARWPEDGVWYRAEVLEVLAQAFLVIFIDYGNTAEVEEGDMVATVGEVPAEEREMVDELALSGGMVVEQVD